MRKPLIGVVLCLFAVMAMAKTPAKKPVMKVTRVEATMKGNVVTIHATGEVPTTGWKNAVLVPQNGGGPDTLIYRFEAQPPSGITHQTITPIKASKKTGPLLPPFPQKVKVVAETNDMTVDIKH